jgi:hypothetical protein
MYSGFVIGRVREHSQAEKVGLKPGDFLIAVDEKDACPLNLAIPATVSSRLALDLARPVGDSRSVLSYDSRYSMDIDFDAPNVADKVASAVLPEKREAALKVFRPEYGNLDTGSIPGPPVVIKWKELTVKLSLP